MIDGLFRLVVGPDGRSDVTTNEDLERRLAELERWREAEQRILLQALHDTQADHGRALTRIENAVSGLTTEMGSFRLEMRSGFAMLAALIDPENESGPDDRS